MNKILVAVDGSAHAQKALDITASLAKQHDSTVIVLHVASDKGISREMREGMEIEYASDIDQRLKSLDLRAPLPDEAQYARTLLSHSSNITRVVNTLAGENVLKRATASLHGNDVKAVESYLADGDPADRIIEFAEKHKAETIVMGCRGTGKLQGLLMGSVSQAVAHDADCSVIIVK